MAVIGGVSLGSAALSIGSGLWTYKDRRNAHPNESLALTLGYVGLSFAAPQLMLAKSFGDMAGMLGEAAFTQYRYGHAEVLRSNFTTGRLGGDFQDTERAQMLRHETMNRGMSMRQALAGQLGKEARRFHRGVYS